MGIALFLIEKTSTVVSFCLLGMLLLLIFPVLHFAQTAKRRVGFFVGIIIILFLFGILIWPKGKKSETATAAPIPLPTAAPQPTPTPKPTPAPKPASLHTKAKKTSPANPQKSTSNKPSNIGAVQPSVSAPNGVAISGNNYGSATVNNFGPKPLVISDDQQAQIIASLRASGITSGKVFMYIDHPSNETLTFGRNLQKALESVGVAVTFQAGILFPPQNDPMYPGLSFQLSQGTMPLGRAIANALIESQVIDGPVRATEHGGDMWLIVRPR